jgi:hypothetical protein
MPKQQFSPIRPPYLVPVWGKELWTLHYLFVYNIFIIFGNRLQCHPRCPCKPSWHLWHGSCPASKTFTYENVKIDSPQNVTHLRKPSQPSNSQISYVLLPPKWFLQLFPRNSTHLFVTRQISFLWVFISVCYMRMILSKSWSFLRLMTHTRRK